MNSKTPSIGFVGGGRITAILLSALDRNPGAVARVAVSDPDPEVRGRLLSRFPEMALGADNKEPARRDLVFLALHAPTLRKALPEIAGALTTSAIVVSLAPVVTLAELSRLLGGFGHVVRMIPNAPSLVGDGFNPTTYGPAITAQDRALLAGIFSAFGRYPEVAEEKLEAYAVLTAMGPTYLWFQLEVLRSLATSFGLTDRRGRDRPRGDGPRGGSSTPRERTPVRGGGGHGSRQTPRRRCAGDCERLPFASGASIPEADREAQRLMQHGEQSQAAGGDGRQEGPHRSETRTSFRRRNQGVQGGL